MQRPLLMAIKFELICKEIYKFQDSLRDSNVKMDYLILSDIVVILHLIFMWRCYFDDYFCNG